MTHCVKEKVHVKKLRIPKMKRQVYKKQTNNGKQRDTNKKRERRIRERQREQDRVQPFSLILRKLLYTFLRFADILRFRASDTDSEMRKRCQREREKNRSEAKIDKSDRRQMIERNKKTQCVMPMYI